MEQPKFISNPVLDKLPAHLRQYIMPQNYEHYTPENQAVWRYAMRKNAAFLPTIAHESYLEGLGRTGISMESIPSMYGMNRILQDIGWAAVAVNGLIPSAAFMEFQAYNVLVIASDIRMLVNIEYTPTPDILHESAGHAPLVAIPEYAAYLRRFGELGAKAISSDQDRLLFEAVRDLATLKERADTSETKVKELEQRIVELQNEITDPSELQQIKNLHWWTIEYGLIGDLANPKIYGAGLLSSIGESKWCMSEEVNKTPFTLDAALQSFDVTKPQPQLFVTPSFAYLSEVLEQFANTMAVRRGGKIGVERLIISKQLGTIELSTGLQISGLFTELILNKKGTPAYVQTAGPTALSYREKELIGQSVAQHPDGFGTAIGMLKGINLSIENMSPRDLQAYKILEGEDIELIFEGDIIVKGKVQTGTRNIHGKIMLIALHNCTVAHNERVIFHPQRGVYHLAIGMEIISAFAGPADLASFDMTDHHMTSPKFDSNPDVSVDSKQSIYHRIRTHRECEESNETLSTLIEEVLKGYSNEWLILLEVYELAVNVEDSRSAEILTSLQSLQESYPSIAHLIEDGLVVIK